MNVSKLQNGIATCSATLCNKPALLLSLKWLHWTREPSLQLFTVTDDFFKATLMCHDGEWLSELDNYIQFLVIWSLVVINKTNMLLSTQKVTLRCLAVSLFHITKLQQVGKQLSVVPYYKEAHHRWVMHVSTEWFTPIKTRLSSHL